VPLGVWCSGLIEQLFEACLDVAGTPPSGDSGAGLLRPGIIKFISGATVTLFPAVLSPKPWPVAIVLFAVGLLLSLAPVGYRLAMHYASSQVLLAVGAFVVDTLGGGLALYLVRRFSPPPRGTAVEKS